MGKDPMDMEQYFLQFGACRIPGKVKDTLDFNPNSKHIVVAHNNEVKSLTKTLATFPRNKNSFLQFFKMQVLTDDGLPISEEQLFGSLKYILQESKKMGPNENPVGVLTAMGRDDWYEAYQQLLPGNDKTLKAIQSSLLVMCLDKDTSNFYPGDDQARTAAQALHGFGPKTATGNRWFDKTLQVSICA